MACKMCRSKNVRRTERGALIDTYYCEDCCGGYEKISPMAKRAALLAAGFPIVFLP